MRAPITNEAQLFISDSALFCFETGVSLVDNIGPATAANDLAVTVARLECFDRGFHFHGFGPDVRTNFRKCGTYRPYL